MNGWDTVGTALWVASVIGIGANLDNTGVGIAYGLANVRFPHRINAVVNGVGFAVALIGAYMGRELSQWIPDGIAQIAACAILCGIGVYMVGSALLRRTRSADAAGRLRVPSWRDGVLLGLSLSFTNIACSLSLTVTALIPPWLVSLSIGIWGYVTLWMGNRVSKRVIAQRLGKYSSCLAGLCLILVGIHQLL